MVTIRQGRSDDLPAILALSVSTAKDQVSGREAPGATWQGLAAQVERMFMMALAVPGALILVAEGIGGGGAGLAGYALLMPQANPFTGERELIVLDIWTHPALRGQRVGRRLLDEAATYARSQGCASLAAQIALPNQASLRLFTGAGYQPERVVVGRRL